MEQKDTIKTYLDLRKKFIEEIEKRHEIEISELEKYTNGSKELPEFYQDIQRRFKEISEDDMHELVSTVLSIFYSRSLYPVKNADVHEKTAKEIIEENGYDASEMVLLENESYDSALIGVTTEGKAVYSYDKMVQWYMNKNNCSEEEAMEWIDYNTLRAIPYAGVNAPIVITEFDGE